MDTRTGEIYDSKELALAAGVPEKHLVTATHRETLEELRKRLKINNKYAPHQSTREMRRRVLQSAHTKSE